MVQYKTSTKTAATRALAVASLQGGTSEPCLHLVGTPTCGLLPHRTMVALVTKKILQKGWYVAFEVRLQKTLQPLSWSLSFSGVTHSGQSQVPCHEHPYGEAHVARNSHRSELKSRSPISDKPSDNHNLD